MLVLCLAVFFNQLSLFAGCILFGCMFFHELSEKNLIYLKSERPLDDLIIIIGTSCQPQKSSSETDTEAPSSASQRNIFAVK